MLATVPFAMAWTLAALVGDAIPWIDGDLDRARAEARRSDRPILVYFHSPSSDHCQRLASEAFDVAAGPPVLEKFVCTRVDIESPAAGDLVGRFAVGIVPTVLVLSSAGRPDELLPGYRPGATLLNELRQVLNGQGTVSDLEARVTKNPRDLLERLGLARKLADLGLTEEADRHRDEIRRRDPRGKSDAGARLLLEDAIASAIAASDPTNPSSVDPQPVVALLDRIRHPVPLFEGWRWVAAVESARGNHPLGREALANAWPHVPDDQSLGWLTEAARAFVESPDELSTQERKIAVELGKAAAAKAESALRQTPAPETRMVTGAFEVLARSYLLQGKVRGARESLRRGLEVDPSSTALRRLDEELAARRKNR